MATTTNEDSMGWTAAGLGQSGLPIHQPGDDRCRLIALAWSPPLSERSLAQCKAAPANSWIAASPRAQTWAQTRGSSR